MRKFVAELIGTCVLVVFGCGTAMLTGCEHWGGYLLTALAFGLVIVGMAYCVGNISGCHINPAVSLGVLISGGMKGAEFILYIVAQFIGALLGGGILALIFGTGGVNLTFSKRKIYFVQCLDAGKRYFDLFHFKDNIFRQVPTSLVWRCLSENRAVKATALSQYLFSSSSDQ